MKQGLGRIAAITAVLGMTLVATWPAAAADGECLGRREIQDRINSGQLRQLSESMASAGVDGKIISSGAEVCMVNGKWQWRVNVMDAYGESKPVTVPAE